MCERLKTFTFQHILEQVVIECSERLDIAILGASGLYFDAKKLS